MLGELVKSTQNAHSVVMYVCRRRSTMRCTGRRTLARFWAPRRRRASATDARAGTQDGAGGGSDGVRATVHFFSGTGFRFGRRRLAAGAGSSLKCEYGRRLRELPTGLAVSGYHRAHYLCILFSENFTFYNIFISP